jgi:phenylacetate-CoA ligase
VLTKEDIRYHFRDLLSLGFPKSALVASVSGGTGSQIKFYKTREQLGWELAAEFRAYRWAGYHLGERCLTFWGSPIDLAKHVTALKHFASVLERTVLLNTYVLSDDVLSEYAYLMQKFHPEIIRGYASSIYLVAKFMLEKSVRCLHVKVVFTSAETLLDFQRETIEKAFRCPVFDYYGSREIGAIAAECEEHCGYHVSAENVVTEFVRSNEHVATGEEGTILVTDLRNFGMPFIRYAIGDVGRPSDEECKCGRGLPLMSSIDGRISQFMAVYDKRSGRIIPVSTASPGVFGSILMHTPIESFRIIQESLDTVVIKAVKGREYTHKHTDFLINNLHKYLGDNIAIKVEFVDYLPPLPSGKRSTFISKINAFEQ